MKLCDGQFSSGVEFLQMVGSKKQGFWQKINTYTQRKPLYFENTGSASLSKSADIVLSKSIFYVKS